jgi:type II secretory pathway predicted ATPase ExeA/septal ring-binding cell division protein DamX
MTMYLEHFGLREAPFRITPHTEFFFSGANRGATLEALLYAITAGEGMVKVTGEVGSGKTMLCRVLMERLPASVETIYLAVPSLTRDEMLAAIAADLDIETAGANTTKLVRALQERLIEMHANGKQVVALIDEAHAMPLATLEEIRLLSNLETEKDKLLQIVLFGQPELDQHLALPHMRQLKERITHSFVLGPLPSRDVHEYINFRLRAAGYHGPDLFGADALRILAEASEGLTRRINIYADKTLLAAFAAGTHTVTADHARAAVSDTQIVMTRRDSPRRTAWIAALGVAAGVVLGFAGAHLASKRDGVAAPSTAAAAPTVATAATALEALPTASAPQGAAAGLQPASATLPAPAAAPKPAPAVVDARLAAGREILENKQPGYSVQLLVTDARSRDFLEHYLADAARTLNPEQFYLVPTGTPDLPRLGLLLGTYHERGDAVAALDALPEPLRQFRPYVRTLDAVRDEARRAATTVAAAPVLPAAPAASR